MRIVIAALLALACLGAGAAEIEGVKFPDQAQVAGATLPLNGVGLRKRAFFRVYVMGLYLGKKTSAAAEAIAAPGPKHVAIHMLRDVDAKTFSDALGDGIRDNHPEAEAKGFESRQRELAAIMAEVGEAKENMKIDLDWVPGQGTVVSIAGKPRGKPIAGEDFYRALLRIWLGPNPVQDDLKAALLGGKG